MMGHQQDLSVQRCIHSLFSPDFLYVDFVLRQALGKDGLEQIKECKCLNTRIIGLGSYHP